MPVAVPALPLSGYLVPRHYYVGPSAGKSNISESLDGSTDSGTYKQSKIYISPDQNKLLSFPEWKRFDVINLPPNGRLFSLSSGT